LGNTSRVRRALVIAAVSLVTVLAFAGPAFGHVEVKPESADHGSTTTFTFTVPNEQDNAKTVKVEIRFPESTSFATVTPLDVPGWTATSTAESVTWSGGAIAGEDKVDFAVTLGPAPASGESMTFKALQTYDNGDVVRWIDEQTGAAEPPHPAPVVKLTGPAAEAPTTTRAVDTTAIRRTPKDDDSGTTRAIVIGAVFVAAVGAGLAIAMQRRRRA
jgi:uncharacterized protein YcnI